MKKSIIASVIALGMMGGVAHAANSDNTVIFHGAVSATTCDITPSQNGQLLADSSVYLGTVAPNDDGQEIDFILKAKNPTDPACANLTAAQTATVSWVSAFLDADGLQADKNNSTATDAKVLLKNVNAKTNPGAAITASAHTAEFEANKIISDGLQFKAQLKGGAESGPFQTAASFSVAYK